MPIPGHQPADVGQTLADLLCMETDTQPAESRRGWMSDRVVTGADALIKSTGIMGMLEQWYREDHPDWETRGGAPIKDIPVSAVLTVFFALARAGEPPLISRITEAIMIRLHTPVLDLLDLPRHFTGLTYEAVYQRVYRRLRWVLNLIDPYPGLQRRSRPTREERDAWLAGLDRDLVDSRLLRLRQITDAILHATALLVPPDAFAKWQGDVCIDATLVKTWGKNGNPKSRGNADSGADWMSPEALAGLYVRNNPEAGKAKVEPGYEAHLPVMAARTNRPDEYPLLVLGMTLERPGQNIGENATTLLKSLHDRGLPAGILSADRAYLPGSKPAKLQNPARALGYLLVCDYREDQLGIQAEYGGAILVEGTWYCPSMPPDLINATKDRRQHVISDDVYEQKIAQRTRYEFTRKQAPQPNGTTTYTCPARGPGATASCPLADQQQGPVNLRSTIPRRRALTPITNPPEHPDIACTNRNSITIPITASDNIAKYAQDFAYQSPEWKAVYQPARSTIEAYNGYVKAPTEEDLEQPARRRVRGYAFQALAVAVIIAAANLRKIDTWLDHRDTEQASPPDPPRRRRRSTYPDLAAYLPPDNGPPIAIPA